VGHSSQDTLTPGIPDAGLKDGFFPAVVSEMLIQGFPPDDIGKVSGGNYYRIFGKATAGRA
jgi:hypothetical protein